MMIWLGLVFIVLLLAAGALFAGAETGVYRLSRFRLRLGVEHQRPAYQILSRAMHEGQSIILSLLLGTNFVHYLITSIFTLILCRHVQNEHIAELYAMLVLTPVLFIFCEIVPKNVFYYRADVLMPRLAWAIWAIYRFFTMSGLLWAIKGLLTIFSRVFHLNLDTPQAVDKTQRHQVRQIIHETQEEGLLSETQRDMISRLIDIPGVSVGSVMIGLENVEKIPVTTSRSDLIKHLQKSRFTRQIVFGEDSHEILGYLSIYDVLGREEDFETVQPYVIPLIEIERKTPVIEAINVLRNRHERIALVIESGRPLGIITISDLIEELTGESAI
jgi:CBS domain containing-hemolysin-like protein